MLFILIAVLIIFPFADSSGQKARTHEFRHENTACERQGEGLYQCKTIKKEEVNDNDEQGNRY